MNTYSKSTPINRACRPLLVTALSRHPTIRQKKVDDRRLVPVYGYGDTMVVLLYGGVPLPSSFFLRFDFSSRRFPFVSCIAFFAFLFASLLSLAADSVVLLFRLGATPPPALLASLKYAYFPCVLSSFLRC